MKTILITAIILVAAIVVRGQVDWKFSAKKISDKTYEIHMTATVDMPWHTYSQSSPKGGPLPTSITFTKNPLVQLVGKAKEEGDMEIHHSEVFDVDVYSYAGKVDFVQTVKLKTKAKTTVSGTIDYMACTDQQCTPPMKVPFNVKLE